MQVSVRYSRPIKDGHRVRNENLRCDAEAILKGRRPGERAFLVMPGEEAPVHVTKASIAEVLETILQRTWKEEAEARKAEADSRVAHTLRDQLKKDVTRHVFPKLAKRPGRTCWALLLHYKHQEFLSALFAGPQKSSCEKWAAENVHNGFKAVRGRWIQNKVFVGPATFDVGHGYEEIFKDSDEPWFMRTADQDQ